MRETRQELTLEARLETIERLSSVKKPNWLKQEVGMIQETYSKLREHILTNKTKWNYFEQSLRFSYHYYNTSLLFYTFFEKYKINLDIIRIYMNKCMSQLNSVGSLQHSLKIHDLCTKATAFKKAVDNIYTQLDNKLNSAESRQNKAKLLINLGHVDYENFDFFAPDLSPFHTHILVVLLINFVADVEEILTLHIEDDHYSNSNMCRFLARVYQICGLHNLHEDYMNRASQQVNLAFGTLGEEDTSRQIRQSVRKIIKEQVLEFYKELNCIYKDVKQE